MVPHDRSQTASIPQQLLVREQQPSRAEQKQVVEDLLGRFNSEIGGGGGGGGGGGTVVESVKALAEKHPGGLPLDGLVRAMGHPDPLMARAALQV